MLILTDIQKVTLTIQPVDRRGNPAPVENVVWSTSDADIAAVTASEDGLTAEVVAGAKLGTAQISVQADAKIGEGVTAIAGTLDVQNIASEAAVINVQAGTPEDQ